MCWDVEAWQLRNEGGNLPEVYVLDWQINEVLLGHTLVQYQGSALTGTVHIIGTYCGSAPWAQAGPGLI